MKDLSALWQRLEIRAVSVPWKHLAELDAEQVHFARHNTLTDSQRQLLHMPALPEMDFVPQSLLMLAAPLRLVDMVFHDRGRSFSDIGTLFPENFPKNAQEALQNLGYHSCTLEMLPLKRLAACSGLAAYGRNNIAYVAPWGSLVALGALATDMPADQDLWHIQPPNLPDCAACGRCLHACPTKALRSDRFLMDNEHCLTWAMQNAQQDFPSWVPKKSIHHLTGCMICQRVCPLNAPLLAKPRHQIHIDEEETQLLLSHAELPPAMLNKLDQLEIRWILPTLARNLAALMEAKN